MSFPPVTLALLVPRPALASLPAALLAALVLSPSADAATRQWATVNLCKPVSAPHSVGVRASMSGTGHLTRMFMRFRAQYILPGRHRWHPVKGSGGVSPWVDQGRARTRTVQTGWNFDLDPASAQASFLVRGLVDFQWRSKRRREGGRPARWVVVKRRRAATRGGIRGADGGDPPGTSLTTCLFP